MQDAFTAARRGVMRDTDREFRLAKIDSQFMFGRLREKRDSHRSTGVMESRAYRPISPLQDPRKLRQERNLADCNNLWPLCTSTTNLFYFLDLASVFGGLVLILGRRVERRGRQSAAITSLDGIFKLRLDVKANTTGVCGTSRFAHSGRSGGRATRDRKMSSFSRWLLVGTLCLSTSNLAFAQSGDISLSGDFPTVGNQHDFFFELNRPVGSGEVLRTVAACMSATTLRSGQLEVWCSMAARSEHPTKT